jgi:hypothetical protein
MTREPQQPESEGNEQVTDDGSVDQRVKERILDSREKVDETRSMVYVQGALDPDINLSREELNHIYATAVREYIQNVEPILRDDDVEHAHHYYLEEPIASQNILPPEQADTDWATLAAAEDPLPLMRQLGLPPDFEPPQPRTVELVGLADVLEVEQKQLTWTIIENPSAAPPNQRVRRLSKTWRPGRTVLNRAVRITDEFLHKVGIGIDTKSEHETKITKDLVEEVEEWRQKNIED